MRPTDAQSRCNGLQGATEAECAPAMRASLIRSRRALRLPELTAVFACNAVRGAALGRCHTSTAWCPGGSGGRQDRVVERWRAVALARHYREAEGLTIAQIAERLGRSPATVKAYFYDPSCVTKRRS